MVDQDLAHHSPRDAQEVCAAPVIGLFLSDQFDIGFVDQGSRLQGMPDAFLAELAGRESAEFAVDERDNMVQRAFIAGGKLTQLQRDSRRVHVWRGASVESNTGAGISR